jgi:hypothetical protein
VKEDRDCWRAKDERFALRRPPEPEQKPVTWWRWLRSTG